MAEKPEIVGEAWPVKIEDSILADFKKTGFPLEIWAAKKLKQEGWKVVHQEYYENLESESRTIDVSATKSVRRPGQIPDRLTIKLVIECKQIGKNKPKKDDDGKKKNPWIFYVEDKDLSDNVEQIAENQIRYVYVGRTQNQLSNTLCKSHLIRSSPRYSMMAMEAFSGGFNQTTYEGIKQVEKATNYFQKVTKRLKEEEKLLNGLFIFYPIIILDCPMFELTLDEKGKHVLTKSTHTIHSSEYEGSRLFIDVVRKDQFPNLLQEIEVEIR